MQVSSIHTQLTFGAGMHYEAKDTRAGRCHTQYKTCLESTYVPKSQDHTVPCRLQMVPTKAGSKPCPVGQAFLTVGSCPLQVPFLCPDCLPVSDAGGTSCPWQLLLGSSLRLRSTTLGSQRAAGLNRAIQEVEEFSQFMPHFNPHTWAQDMGFDTICSC